MADFWLTTISQESILQDFNEGRPLFVRKPDSKFNLANFMRVHLYTSLGALKTGMNILLEKRTCCIGSNDGTWRIV